MSHWTVIKTSIRNIEVLKDTLGELYPGKEIIEKSTVRGFNSRTQICDLVLRAEGCYGGYDIGFQRREDGTLEIIADWWGAKRWAGEQGEFTDRLMQHYSSNAVVREAVASGWIISTKVQEGETIRLELTKY